MVVRSDRPVDGPGAPDGQVRAGGGSSPETDPLATVATTTFLFTDIEGSTRLVREAGAAYIDLLDTHRRLLRDAFRANGGREVGTEGDSFLVVFPTPRQGASAAVAGQLALAGHPWPDGRGIKVRMGLHTGEVTVVGDDLVGLEVHRAARIAASGHGGQILVSEATATLIGDVLTPGTSLRELGRYGLKDFDRAERIFQLDAPGLSADFPQLKARPGPPRVPVPATPLVGRLDELRQLCELLQRERLVTLTGPGGIGKTRLAVQVAADLATELPDGAVFVSLTSLQDPELVATTVARALDVREEGCEDALDALKVRLEDRRMLLVLDNFEQVLGATPLVTALLDAAPHVTVLITSRVALRVRAEHEFPVGSLPVDDGVRLFVGRAEAVRHDFRLDEVGGPTVQRIVDALEGVPLAIELAAARARVLPLASILERLDHRLDLLVGGAPDLPERQRALRATLDWSYDLLDDEDRRLFACLGVFAGSFSLAAAEAVCGPGRTRDTLDGLTSLVDKSLLRAEPTGSEPRFRMLVMVRDYAGEKLTAAPEGESVRRRYADYYRDMSLMVGNALRGPAQTSWVVRLSSGSGYGDIDNVRATLRWHLDHGQPDEVARIVWSMWLLGWISGRLEECRWWSREALACHERLSRQGRARLLTVAGLMEVWSGQYTTSMPALTDAVAIARELDDDDLLATSLLGLGLVTCFAGDPAAARILVEEAHRLFRAGGNAWGQATVFSLLTWFLVAEDDFERSGPVFDDARAAALDLGADDLNRAIIETNVAEHRLHVGDHDGAAELLASSVRRYQTLAAFHPSSYAIEAAARLANATGRPLTAAVLLGGADRAREAIGVPVEGAHRSRRQRLVDRLASDLGDAAVRRGMAQGRALRYEEVLDVALAATTATPAGGASTTTNPADPGT